jgi:hypothetical protein
MAAAKKPVFIPDHLKGLRPLDVIAKIAHCPVRDVIRVLLAAQTVTNHLNIPVKNVVESIDFSGQITAPEPVHVAACEQAYAEVARIAAENLAQIESYR